MESNTRALLQSCHILTAVTAIGGLFVIGSRETNTTLDDPDRRDSATITNVSDHDMVTFVSAEGIEWRLGHLPAGERRTFLLPPAVARQGKYCLVADLLGS